jgi:hypothetical protein
MKAKEKSEILQITEIKLRLSDKKEITLSSDEARKVYDELYKLFKIEDRAEQESENLETLKKLFKDNKKEYVPYPVYPQPYNYFFENIS